MVANIKKLKVGHRIYILMFTTLIFLMMIGGTGYYKMNQIGHELKGISERDIPLTEILTKITVHQLEQAILLEQTLRYKGITDREEGHTAEQAVEHFVELAHKVDKEIKQAEHMAEDFIQEAKDPKAVKEFKHVLSQLKMIEKHHKDYDDHAFGLFNRIGIQANIDIKPQDIKPHAGDSNSSLQQDVASLEKEQSQLDKEIEALLFEVEKFTQDAANKALRDEERGKVLILGMSFIILIVASILSFLLGQSIRKPLSDLTQAVDEMKKGNLDVGIPTSAFEDEIHSMSGSIEEFRKDLIRVRELEQQQDIDRERRQRQQNELNQLTGIFGSTIGAVFAKILSSSNMMVKRAGNMKNDSTETKNMAMEVAKEAEESSSNANALSAATEEMVASVQEISKRVSQSSDVAREAVNVASDSKSEVEELQKIAEEIGDVVSLITDIAEQTNLLALNATIEAARAGDAGKGFAVVASEVKSLASETAKATDEISEKISRIQDASKNSAASIQEIGKIIQQVDEFISAIVAAVEQQSATTQEMSRNVSFVAESSTRVTENIATITSQAENVGNSSEEVNTSAMSMAEEAEVLSKEVKTFLNAMQNTDSNDETFAAKTVNLEATGQVNGANWSGNVSEISSAYASIKPAMDYTAGEKVSITISGINHPLEARIAKNENGATILQFPLDLGHLAKMQKEIEKLA